jgi:hypothetical protein
MDDPSIDPSRAPASFRVAIAYLLIGIFAVLMPTELQEIAPHDLWSANPAALAFTTPRRYMDCLRVMREVDPAPNAA